MTLAVFSAGSLSFVNEWRHAKARERSDHVGSRQSHGGTGASRASSSSSSTFTFGRRARLGM